MSIRHSWWLCSHFDFQVEVDLEGLLLNILTYALGLT